MYYVDINSTGKTWLSFNLSMLYQVAWRNSNCGGFTFLGS